MSWLESARRFLGLSPKWDDYELLEYYGSSEYHPEWVDYDRDFLQQLNQRLDLPNISFRQTQLLKRKIEELEERISARRLVEERRRQQKALESAQSHQIQTEELNKASRSTDVHKLPTGRSLVSTKAYRELDIDLADIPDVTVSFHHSSHTHSRAETSHSLSHHSVNHHSHSHDSGSSSGSSSGDSGGGGD